MLFKIFLPETESILLDNVRKVVLCVNLDSVFSKVFEVLRRTSFPIKKSVQQILPSLLTFSHCISIFLSVLPKAIKDFSAS